MIERGTVDVGAMRSAVAPLSEGAAWFDRLYKKERGLMKVILKPLRAPMEKLKTAVIGYGKVAHTHAEALATHPRVGVRGGVRPRRRRRRGPSASSTA